MGCGTYSARGSGNLRYVHDELSQMPNKYAERQAEKIAPQRLDEGLTACCQSLLIF